MQNSELLGFIEILITYMNNYECWDNGKKSTAGSLSNLGQNYSISSIFNEVRIAAQQIVALAA